MDKLGDVPTPPDLLKVPNTVRVVRALSRLVKLDFWLRNPDYLADELLNDVEIAGLDPSVALPHVARMLEGSAPVLHLYPMQRYKYGAWELPDNAVAILKLHGFATTKRAKEMDAAASSKARRDYFLLPEGRDALQRMREDVEQLSWYDAQADAIALLDLPGTGLAAKQRQYQQPEYAATPVGATIEPILIRVRSRFERVSALHGLGSAAEHTPDHSENGRNSK